jgi:16S rRNA processing protein RimM
MPYLTVGLVTRPHGVRGEVRVAPDTDFPERLLALRRVYLSRDGRRTSHTVERVRPQGAAFLLKLASVDTADAAERLRGAALQIPRSEAAPLPEGQYYIGDVIGLRAETTDGERLGWVEEVLRTGSNDVYVVRGGGREVLVPAIADVVREIAPDRGVLVVWPMPGLIPDATKER